MITKRLSPQGRSMRVIFDLPPEVAEEEVLILGSFNNWNRQEPVRMERHPKAGVWRAGISFKPGERVEFKYLVDGQVWRNDEQADRYVGNEHGTENSVLHL